MRNESSISIANLCRSSPCGQAVAGLCWLRKVKWQIVKFTSPCNPYRKWLDKWHDRMIPQTLATVTTVSIANTGGSFFKIEATFACQLKIVAFSVRRVLFLALFSKNLIVFLRSAYSDMETNLTLWIFRSPLHSSSFITSLFSSFGSTCLTFTCSSLACATPTQARLGFIKAQQSPLIVQFYEFCQTPIETSGVTQKAQELIHMGQLAT